MRTLFSNEAAVVYSAKMSTPQATVWSCRPPPRSTGEHPLDARERAVPGRHVADRDAGDGRGSGPIVAVI